MNSGINARAGREPLTAVQTLDRVAERWRTLAWRQLAVRALAGAAAIWFAAWLIERFGSRAPLAALVVSMSALAATAAWLAWVAWSRRPVPEPRDLARFIEEHCPSLEERLITAVDVTARDEAPPSALAGAMLADADRAIAGLTLDEVIPSASLRRSAVKVAAAAVVALAAAALWVEPGRRALQMAALRLFPGHYALTVSPGDARVRPDERFTIAATSAAPFGTLTPELEISIGDERRRLAMGQDAPQAFSWTIDRVPASFTYRVSAAGRQSERYQVTLLQPPHVRRIDLHYQFPPYTRLGPRTEEDGGDIFAPAGTRVRVSVHGSKPLNSTALVLSDGGRVELRRIGADAAEGELVVRRDGAYRVALADHDGLASAGDTEYFIRVLDDRPPDVRILRPASDRRVTPLEEVTVEARADDDYGIAAFELVVSVRGGAEKAMPLADVSKRLPTATGRRTLYLEDLGVEPGDFVTYYARARDIGRGKASAEARSDIFFLEVTPFEEEFAAAQSQAMNASGGGQAVDDLVTAQKNIIVATWKLERRAVAGRSAADVEAIGRAQGELRARAARLAQRAAGPAGRRRGNPSGLSPRGAGGAESSIANAVTAMGRAEAALKARDTRAAIPPEMEALNHLLKAQAEVRRREVMRQQAGGAGAGSRADQDLSSLFDRELRRQQQTNYETPRTTEERRDEQDDDVLQRVRELARRQEQLARQQDELAREREQLSAEELKRRLERLAREQSELRRLAEQAAQRSASQSSSSSQAGSSQGSSRSNSSQPSADAKGASAGSSASSQLREASEQMRQAASDLRREAPEQASDRGRQALDRLRSIERSMQGGQPDGQRRAVGDLQLEARQLAERQRQLSRQAAEAGREGDPSSARRRVAGEQDRAAERAERFEEGLSQIAGSDGDSRTREGAQGAAATGDQQFARRMREAARSLREAARTGSGAAADERAARQAQALARDLDGVADRLEPGAAGDREQQRLAGELAATRRLREELDDLGRRIAEARGNGESSRGEGREPSPGSGGPSQRDGEPSDGQEAPLERLQQEYAERARQVERLERGSVAEGKGGGMSTPEGRSPSVSAPGTEAFKQDFSRWEHLHKQVSLRLEQLEATLSQRLLERAARERLQGGAADTTPEGYQQAVDRYFRALADPDEAPAP